MCDVVTTASLRTNEAVFGKVTDILGDSLRGDTKFFGDLLLADGGLMFRDFYDELKAFDLTLTVKIIG